MSRGIVLILILNLFGGYLNALIDLEEMAQDFVLETKQIKIPLYPDAFNPCIIRWKGSMLMSFRARDPLTGVTNVIGFTRLNDNFDPIGEVSLLSIEHEELAGSLVQDPRMIVIKNTLYIVYSNTWKLPFDLVRRVFVSEVQFDGLNYVALNPEVFLRFDGIKDNKFEKNWTPFEYNGNLLLSYTINPHKVFLPIFGKKRCETVAYSEMHVPWDWGEFRGGTQAFVVDGEYLAFFHCTKVIATKHSNGKSMPHYFMGAFTFERSPPFALTKTSPEIIVGKNFYNGPYYQTWKPLRVVFPCGYVFDENTIWVSFGRQDYEMWIVKFDKKKLFKSLIKTQKID